MNKTKLGPMTMSLVFRIVALMLWLWATLVGCAAGSEMGGTGGGGASGGVQCTTPQDCPATANECVTRTCTDGVCGTANSPDGTVCALASACAAGLCTSSVIAAYIKASSTDVADSFGLSVAMSADGNTLAVGAHGEDSNATGINGNQADNSVYSAGVVYVY